MTKTMIMKTNGSD